MPSPMSRASMALTVAAMALSAAWSPAAAQPGGSQGAAPAPACDRVCLIAHTERYLAALAAHDPGAAPLADTLLFVENVTRLRPGEGLWKSATGGPGAFSIHVPDVAQQQAGWMGVIAQEGKPVMLALRLRIAGGRITEAEHIVAAPAGGNMEHLLSVRPGLRSELPASARMPHGALIAVGASYYDALDDNDGAKMPFAPDCQRRENGMTTAGDGAMGPPNMAAGLPPVAHDCKGQLDTGSFTYIDRIEHRRMVAADPVTGLVMGFSHFRHPMTNLPYSVRHVDGSTSERNKANMPYAPFDMPAAHIFKIGADGLVHEIEAVGFIAPYNAPTGRE